MRRLSCAAGSRYLRRGYPGLKQTRTILASWVLPSVKSGLNNFPGVDWACMKETPEGSPFLIIMPVFDDWLSLDPLLQQLDEELSRKDLKVEILVIDDGSTIKAPNHLGSAAYKG